MHFESRIYPKGTSEWGNPGRPELALVCHFLALGLNILCVFFILTLEKERIGTGLPLLGTWCKYFVCVFHFDTGKGMSEVTRNVQFILKGLNCLVILGVILISLTKEWYMYFDSWLFAHPLVLYIGAPIGCEDSTLDVHMLFMCKEIAWSTEIAFLSLVLIFPDFGLYTPPSLYL